MPENPYITIEKPVGGVLTEEYLERQIRLEKEAKKRQYKKKNTEDYRNVFRDIGVVPAKKEERLEQEIAIKKNKVEQAKRGRKKSKDCRVNYNNNEFNGKFESQTLFNDEFVYNYNNTFKEKHYMDCTANVLKEVLNILANKKKTKEELEKKPLFPWVDKNLLWNGVKEQGSDKIKHKGIKQLQEIARENRGFKSIVPDKNDSVVSEQNLIEEIRKTIKSTKKDTIYEDDKKDDLNIVVNNPIMTLKTDPELQKYYEDLNANEYLKKLEKESYKSQINNPYDLDFLYPDLDDPKFSLKIAKRQEFNENKYEVGGIDIETQSELLCNSDFDLMPHQNFVKNFMSHETPYNGILLYHGVGTGKTCSAIGIAEEYRIHLKQYNNLQKKQIIIVASPNVQENFKKQLFDPTKIKISENGSYTSNTCIGNALINEVNPNNNSQLSDEQLSKQIKKIVMNSYDFQGYTQFGNYIEGKINTDNITGYSEEDKIKIQNEMIKEHFNNRLIIVDEAHNLRITDDNEKRIITKNLKKIAKIAKNMKIILLSATPMYNSFSEIIWIVNVLNLNDKRSLISKEEVFDKEGNFLEDVPEGEETGKELLKRKLTGYVSYVRGENPYSFPFRIYPELFSPINKMNKDDFPDLQLNGQIINDKINLPLYMTSLNLYQLTGYSVILKNMQYSLENEKIPDFNELDKFGYNVLNKPLESLNFVYPKPELDNYLNQNINMLNKNEIINIISGSDRKIDIVGKNGLKRVMNFEQSNVKNNYSYKPEILNRYGRIFSLDKLEQFSSKIHSICTNIMNSKGISIIYSQYIEGGAVPIALALEELGFTRYSTSPNATSLFDIPPVEPLDSMYMKPKSQLENIPNFKPARYAMITGDSFFSQKNADDLSFINRPENNNGSLVKVIIISKAASEGLDFANIRQVHIMEPWYNLNRIEQIIGRGVRNLSHCSLPFKERNVEIYMYSMRPILLEEKKLETIDMYVYRLAEKKSKQIGDVTRLLKEISIDCNLNIAQTNLSMNKFKEVTDNNVIKINLASNKTIDYTIGDRPFTSICDYKDNCDYKCSNDEVITQIVSSNYGDAFARTNFNAIVKRIKNIFKEKPFINKNNLIKEINYDKTYPTEQIYYVLTLFINNMETVDRLNRRGHIINRGDYYIFQPIEITDTYATTFERTNDIDYKHNKFILEQPTRKTYKVENNNNNIQENNNNIKEDYNTLLSKLENITNDIIDSDLDVKDIPPNSSWYIEIKNKHVKTFLREKHNFTDDHIKKYVIYHYLDTEDLSIRLEFLNGIYNKNTDELSYTEQIIADYFNKKMIKKDNLNFIIYLKNETIEANDYYIFSDNKFVLLDEPLEKEEYARIEFNSSNIIMKDKMHNVVGFMHKFKNEYAVFKVKDIYSQYNNKGSYCKNLAKEDIIKRLNCLFNSNTCQFKIQNHDDEKDFQTFDDKYTKEEIKKNLRKVGLAIIAEFLFRFYDENNERGLRYFFGPEETITNQIKNIGPDK
jgi:superfamily II DNA or RNA helicase